LLTALSYEVAHDAPIDIALSLAWLRSGLGDLAPIFLAPNTDWAAELEETRLNRRIVELIARLRRLPLAAVLLPRLPPADVALKSSCVAGGRGSNRSSRHRARM
jgi:hypothetical protein